MLRLPEEKKGSKFHSERVKTSEGTFDSRLEKRWLWHLKADKSVVKIDIHPKFNVLKPLRKCPACKRIFDQESLSRCPLCAKPLLQKTGIDYVADFMVTYRDGHIEVQDVKGHMTREFLIKWKLFERAYPEYTLRIVRENEMWRK